MSSRKNLTLWGGLYKGVPSSPLPHPGLFLSKKKKRLEGIGLAVKTLKIHYESANLFFLATSPAKPPHLYVPQRRMKSIYFLSLFFQKLMLLSNSGTQQTHRDIRVNLNFLDEKLCTEVCLTAFEVKTLEKLYSR